jgi:predicted ATPase/class 3 adenylate cyclase
VTFAFTDIEGSTRRWEDGRASMQDAVRRHDAILRASIAAHQGRVFKTVGDAFCAAFARAEDAVAAMLAAQRALAAEDFSAVGGIRVRAAIHTGTADERDGDYFGPALNRVARMLAIGHGGQVLMSGVAADLVRADLPAQASLRDLGEHRLRDLAQPVYVYQLLVPDLAAEFPPLRSLDALPNNLPLQFTSLVGREGEIAEITELIGRHRLVTLVGSGGVGKTRTSLQVAANLLDGSSDGVWFIELAPLSSGDYIPTTVAQALGLILASEGDPVANLVSALKRKNALLVFDNCEHLVAAAARVIAAILRGCPQIRILASSRQGLGVAAEATYSMPSLIVPSEAEASGLTAADSTRYGAIELFFERARAIDNRFSPTDENAPIVADICRRLDGIPLAIELAAARVKVLGPRQLRERLDERFRVLTRGSRDELPRHQTLRALIDWSYDLLDEEERTLFRRLGIFVSGFTLEGAVAVGSDRGLDQADAFDVFASLIDKSLVLADHDGDTLRYRLLESTRAYASEKLEDAGERELLASRHLRYLRDRFAEAQARYNRSARWAELLDLLVAELGDVRAALDWSAASADAAMGCELLVAIGTSWTNLGLEREGIARIEAFLPHGEPRLLAGLLSSLAFLAGNSGHVARGFEAATQAVAQARMCDDPAILADALREYAMGAWRLRRIDDAETALVEAEAISADSAVLRLDLLETRGFVSSLRGDLDTAARVLEQLCKEHRSLGNATSARWMTISLAEVEHERGRTQRAIALVRDVLPEARADSNRRALLCLLVDLAGYLAAVDELPEACAAAREAISEAAPRDPGDTFVAIAIGHLALALALGGDPSRGARLTGYTNAVLQKRGYEPEFNERTTQGRLGALLREALSSDELVRLTSEGTALAPEAAIALALEEPLL